MAYVNALNKADGIGGGKIEHTQADDDFKPALAKTAALAFQADKSVRTLLSTLGKRRTAAIMEAVQDMAMVGPHTDTARLREGQFCCG